MFQCDIRQKLLCHHKGEDYPSNLIVYFIECIELACKTDSPIENLRSIGLIFYSRFFIINLKILSNILIIPSAYIKKLLLYHKCTIIRDMKQLSQIKESQDNKNWSFYIYGITNDSKHLLNILSKFQIFIDQRQINTFEENHPNNSGPYRDTGTAFTPFMLPNSLSNPQNKTTNQYDNHSKIFISNESIHQFGSKKSLNLAPIQLNANYFWPFSQENTKTHDEKS